MKEASFGETDYLSKYTEYHRARLKMLFERLDEKLRLAEESGLSDVFVTFESTMEPYEDYPGDVAVEIKGKRPLNWIEQKAEKEQQRIQALATKMGITFYEASTIDRLQKANKVEVK